MALDLQRGSYTRPLAVACMLANAASFACLAHKFNVLAASKDPTLDRVGTLTAEAFSILSGAALGITTTVIQVATRQGMQMPLWACVNALFAVLGSLPERHAHPLLEDH